MAKLVFAMNVSLDGYVDHEAFDPDPLLFQHWIEHVRGLSASIYGRRLYEIMRYWDDEQTVWSDEEHAFAEVWRAHPKWVASRTLTSVGSNAKLIEGDALAAIRELKEHLPGEVALGGTQLAQACAGLIDEYRLYVHPVVLGGGTPFFAGPRPGLRIVSHEIFGEGVVRLTCVPG